MAGRAQRGQGDVAHEARLRRRLFEGDPDATVLADAGMRLVDANPAAAGLLGYTRAELLGLSVQDIVGTEANWTEAEHQRIHAGAGTWSGDLELRRKDGALVIAEVAARAVRLPDGGTAVRATLRPITDRRRADATDRRRAQAALRLQTSLLDAVAEAVIGTTPEGVVTSWNRGAERLFGYTADKTIGQSIGMIHPPGRAGDLRHLTARLAQGGSVDQYETVRAGKDGQIVDVSLTISPIEDADGQVVGAATVVRDITDQKRAAVALQASEERLRTVLDNAPLILFAVDGEGRSTIRAGQGLTSLAAHHGFPATQQAGQSPYDVYDDHPQMRANVRRALAGESFSSLVEIDGHVFECAYGPIWDAGGKLDGAVSVATDVTEREQARESLQRLKDEHELILQSAGDGIFGQDRDGLTTFVNPAAARMVGWSAEELIGRDMHTTLHGARADGSFYPREACPIQAAVNDGGVHHATGELFWRQDGTSFPVEYTCAPMRDGNRIIGAVVTFKDISERRAAEEERSRLYRKLLERDKELHEAVGAILFSRSTGHLAPGDRDQLARLTARERDVLERLAQGQTNAEIAQALGVGVGTVKSHVEHLLKKLGLVSRTQAAVWADRLGPSAFPTEQANSPSV